MGIFDRFRRQPDRPDRPAQAPAADPPPEPLEPLAGFRSEVAAAMPDDGSHAIGNADLGEGVGVVSTLEAGATERLVWVGRGDSAAIRAARTHFAETGLWPVVLSTESGDPVDWLPEMMLPEADWAAAVDAVDVAATLSARWDSARPLDAAGNFASDSGLPFADFPGLAPRPPHRPGTLDAWTTAQGTGPIGLVAVTRPADVCARIGWAGPANYDLVGSELSAILRSWQDRLGATLVGLGFDTLTLVTDHPPTSLDEALPIAAEHHAVCPDNVWQGAGDLTVYAETLVDQPVWTFWWD